MAQQTIFLGTNPNDGTGELLRGGGAMINNNFTELYALQSQTINAGSVDYDFTGATNEQRIALADADAVLRGFQRIYIPAFMLPYDITLCQPSSGVRRTREGGSDQVYDVRAYGAAGDNVQDDTEAFKAALLASAAGGTTYVPKGDYRLTAKLALTSTGHVSIIGDGQSAARLYNYITGAAADSLIEITVESGKFYLLQGLWFSGNNLHGSSGNGHAIALMDISPGGALSPTQVVIRDCVIESHYGTGKDSTGAAIPACGVYAYGGTGLFVDTTAINNMGMGVRIANYDKAYITTSSIDLCDNVCVYIENSEAIHIANSTLNGSGSGGTKDGLLYMESSKAVSMVGGRLKNGNPYCVNAGIGTAGFAISGLTLVGNSIEQLDAAFGHTAVALSNAVRGVHIAGNDFLFVGTMTDAIGILVSQIASGYEAAGIGIYNNNFLIGNGGTIAYGVRCDVAANKVVAPIIEGNVFGGYVSTTGYTITNGIELSTNVDSASLRNNVFVAVTNVTITNAIRLANAVLNTILENNFYRAFGGTITNQVIQSGGVAYVRFEAGEFKYVSSNSAVGFWEAQELGSDPAAPASNFGRLYFKDNGSGKTQFVVRFPTGAVQVIATEP